MPDETGSLTNPLTVVSWNIQKQAGNDLSRELQTFAHERRADLVFLQEYNGDLSNLGSMGGYFAKSWRYPWLDGTTVGVTTLSAARAVSVRALPTAYREFFVTAPKISLLTRYRLDDCTPLLAVNLHLLTFERWGTLKMKAQLADLESAIAEHEGAVIVAGDFNTWNPSRLELVAATMERLGLEEVSGFAATRTTADLGSRFLNWLLGIAPDLPLDRIYYRGLRVRSATVVTSDLSDHRALEVEFVIPPQRPGSPEGCSPSVARRPVV